MLHLLHPVLLAVLSAVQVRVGKGGAKGNAGQGGQVCGAAPVLPGPACCGAISSIAIAERWLWYGCGGQSRDAAGHSAGHGSCIMCVRPKHSLADVYAQPHTCVNRAPGSLRTSSSTPGRSRQRLAT